MYSVYIVDDQILVINDLLSTIPWLENGFKVIGSNTNSIKAISEITELKPDVVFTDLKMPACNGIQLIVQVKNKIDTEFVMLSAYEDFQASRDFFILGGIDYVLKPLEQNKAAIVLARVSRKLASKNCQTPAVDFVPSKSKNFDDLVRYVTDNFNKKHTLKDLSENFHISQPHICKLFSKQYQSTLTRFLTNIRMSEASRLIVETNRPFKEIALQSGYQDYYHFGRVFKAYFNKSPSQLREERQ